MNAREQAVHVTAKKIAYRQTREGNVVSFAMDPQDIPDKLATDPIGTSYMLALVEIDDATGQPKGGGRHPETEVSERRSETEVPTAPRTATTQPGARKSWDQKNYAEQAGIRCNEPKFHAFLRETRGRDIQSPGEAADYVRLFCGVTSRKALTISPAAASCWRALDAEYLTWDALERCA